ncbi:hypothetical protein [Parapedobacter sp. DT-150]|uniref:hypothetical protein n=1 Tax=Parapedobacter sp. DT-150 TaxID=3396162 RepID=UPI003F1C11B6
MIHQGKDMLGKLIPTLGMSREFTVTMEILGFDTLGDLARHRSKDLLALPGFTRELLYEYVHFMEIHGMGKLIDP